MICAGVLYQAMSSDTINPNHIKSPCIRVCKIVDTTCIGCNRTLEEIRKWTKYTDQEREIIIKRVT